MDKCKQCGSFAINHNCHGRDGSEPQLCDVCYWRNKADQWKNNHDNIANKLRLFTQRNDLPVDRLPAYNHVLELEHQLQEFLVEVEAVYADLLATDLGGDVGSAISLEVMMLQQAIAKIKEKTK